MEDWASSAHSSLAHPELLASLSCCVGTFLKQGGMFISVERDRKVFSCVKTSHSPVTAIEVLISESWNFGP